jgi:heme-degrading monooxygenase HmoA
MNKIEEAIVELNRFKITKPHQDPEMTEKLNSIQRKLEEAEGIKAVELDERYDVQ